MKLSIKAFLASYLTVLLTFAVLDTVWLGLIAMPWYQEAFAPLFRAPFITWPWIAFYLLYCASVVYLIIRPYINQNLIQTAIGGFILGATAYGTYNLTAYSIIAHWPLTMTFVDWFWGSVATMSMAFTGGWVARKVNAKTRGQG
ncbi:DUF2177 family protein [Alteromonas sp. C1M14]|uniref:DUF2177 family protein n=1 Tax=Alteromonas sp. C1M14 TaxID=2841567 RepID=UPI001C0A5B36|nr:DUF2177 family protein [Alteromonas sp. C1M14]MBU2978381.1 DUF2177 family protein [Alteromonas sp. C1M14]